MDKEQFKQYLLESLCWYDPRKPDGVDNEEYLKESKEDMDCSCDACFRGNHKLAHNALILFYP